jgi:hypothetical protein
VPQRILWNEAVPPRWRLTRIGGSTNVDGWIYTTAGSNPCNHLHYNLSYCHLL